MSISAAWELIEKIMVGRINKACIALEAAAELEINTDELLSQMIKERDALRVMRETMSQGAAQ